MSYALAALGLLGLIIWAVMRRNRRLQERVTTAELTASGLEANQEAAARAEALLDDEMVDLASRREHAARRRRLRKQASASARLPGAAPAPRDER